MSVSAVGPITAAIAPLAPIGVNPADAAGGSSFAAELTQGMQNLQTVQSKADDLAVQASTGTLTDVHDYVIASTEANMATQLTVAVRNKALDAFNEIMRMQA